MNATLYLNQRRRVKLKKLIIIILLILSPITHANYYCVGKVVHYGSDSLLHISNGYGIHKICNLSDDKCKNWSSMAMAAYISGKSIAIYYKHDSIGGNQSSGVCKDIGNWVVPSDNVYYIHFK